MKLERLRANYISAVTRAVSPLTKSYTAELEKLKTEFTKAGDLESAIAVDKELKKTMSRDNLPEVMTAKSEDSADSKRELKDYLMETKWTVTRSSDGYNWGEWVFKSDGTVVVNKPRSWSVLSKNSILVEQYQVKFDDSLKTFKVIWGGTGELTGVLAPSKKSANSPKLSKTELATIEAYFVEKTWQFPSDKGALCTFKQGGRGLSQDKATGAVSDMMRWHLDDTGLLEIDGFGHHKKVTFISSTQAEVSYSSKDGKEWKGDPAILSASSLTVK